MKTGVVAPQSALPRSTYSSRGYGACVANCSSTRAFWPILFGRSSEPFVCHFGLLTHRYRGGPGNSDRLISYSRLDERRDAMGKVTRKRYGADFKAKVALDAIKGEQTLAELAAKHGIHQTMIAAWKRQAIEGLTSTFSGKAEAVQANSEAELSRLHAKIGQLVVERDFLAKASGR